MWAKIKDNPGFTIVELLIVVVVIAILAAISIVAYNGITNQAKDSSMVAELSQWKKKAELHKIQNNIECPENYVFVYGNPVLGTSDFCTMKYEAKIQGNDDGATPYSSSMVAESRASGTPWVLISQANAIIEAGEIGGHLMTEAEWMTIAADVLRVKYNWSGGEVGSGFIYSGHTNNSPSSSIRASTDDNEGLFAMEGGFGSSSVDNNRRTLYLSSGDIIWDFSGNVWEYTQQGVGTPTISPSNIGVAGDTGSTWREYNFSGLSFGNMLAVSRPSILAGVDGLEDINSWGWHNGIGMISAYYADTGTRVFIRGGAWWYTSYGGVMTLMTGHGPSAGGSDRGFRVVL